MNTVRADKKVLSPPPPSLWEYRDARRYLNDLIVWKKEVEGGFSFRRLAFLADLGSPNYIQMFLKGARNFKPQTARRVGEALGLKGKELDYFVVLIQFTQAEDEEERGRWYEELLRFLIRQGIGTIDAHRLNYFRYWYIPVIHAMASLKGFHPDPEWIAQKVVPPIRPREAELALQTLKELGILVLAKDGTFEVKEPRLETSEGIRSIWIREYHRAMIRLAEASLDQWSPELRTTSAVTITVPRKRISEILQWVDRYRREIFERISLLIGEEVPVDGEVMQINFQGFLVTDITDQFSQGYKVKKGAPR
jgi:uncharacterized protein (TIGR02147 family)